MRICGAGPGATYPTGAPRRVSGRNRSLALGHGLRGPSAAMLRTMSGNRPRCHCKEFMVAHRFLSRGPLAAIVPLLPRRLQFPIPGELNLLLMPGEHVLRRDVSDGAVQTHVVVMRDVTLDQTPRIFQ
jgi:hypothetical protein